MERTTRGLLLKALVVAGGAIGLLTNPMQARTAVAEQEDSGAGGCVWCSDTCADLIGFCSGKNCPVLNDTCSNSSGCQGTNGHWYDYRITCA